MISNQLPHIHHITNCHITPQVISHLLQEKINWALIPFIGGLTCKNLTATQDYNIGQLRIQANKREKKWGNQMIGQKANGNWTTCLGEGLVKEVLELGGENVRRPERRGGYEPDWETDSFIYEVKTRNWTTSGTAGEKVLGVMYKYSDIPELYGKPLKIFCVGYQEYELTHGPTKIFGEVSNKQRAFLNLANSFDIEYVKFSDLVEQHTIYKRLEVNR
jgi:hypothetical protein